MLNIHGQIKKESVFKHYKRLLIGRLDKESLSFILLCSKWYLRAILAS
jgi:hypothetical protein